ncbi:MAG TPA: lipid II flippase MurJ [Candidatus Paceibacterota bacterium]|nr:lipid II flippase MurJ [Candidatus Paceibacterota bacterium]
MVKRILSFVGREISGLHEAAYLLAGSAAASLAFALVRDRLLAHILGASPALDVYYAAFRVPDFIFVAVASLVSTSILVPFLIESREKEAGGMAGELRYSIQSLFSAFFVLIVIVCSVAFFLMPWLDRTLFPKLFEAGLGDTLVTTSRLLLLSPVLLGFSSFFASITQIQNRFMVYAVSYPLYNVGIIAGILFLLPNMGVSGLAVGVIFGALLLSLTQIPLVIKDGLFPRFTLRFDWAKVKRVAALSVPRTITLSSQQLTNLGLVSFASFLGAGSISIFNLALNLQSVPLSIIGASYSSAAFPVLAKLMAQKEREAFVGKMISAAKHVIFWSIPITILFIVLRAQIVRVVLGTGQFTWSDTRLTAAALALFVISSFGQSLMLLFVRSFYAEGKTAKPLVINVISMVVTVGLGFGLVKLYHAAPSFAYFVQSLLRTDGTSDSSVLMLPLAFSIGALLNLWLHWRSFSREFPGFTKPVMTTMWHSIGASVIGGYAAYLSLGFFDGIFGLTTLLGVFLQGLCAGLIGIIAIVLVLKAMKSPEMKDIHEAVANKVWRVDKASLDKLPS